MPFANGQNSVMTNESDLIAIEVVYGEVDRQVLLKVYVKMDATIEEAIRQSSLLQAFPHLDLARVSVGIYGELKKLEDNFLPGDRIEIYRPLSIDPKSRRRKRALVDRAHTIAVKV